AGTRAAALALAAVAWLAAGLSSPALGYLEMAACYAHRIGAVEDVGGSRPRAGDVLSALWRRGRALERVPSRYQRVELINAPFEDTPMWSFFNGRPKAEPGLPYGLTLFLDRRYQFRGGAEAVYHEFF